MRLRATLAGWLVMVLLSVSCLGSTCVLACDLSHASGMVVAETGHATDGMSASCGHMAAGKMKDVALSLAATACKHTACAPDEATAISGGDLDVQHAPSLIALVSPIDGPHGRNAARFVGAAYTAFIPLSPPRLSAVLRL